VNEYAVLRGMHLFVWCASCHAVHVPDDAYAGRISCWTFLGVHQLWVQFNSSRAGLAAVHGALPYVVWGSPHASAELLDTFLYMQSLVAKELVSAQQEPCLQAGAPGPWAAGPDLTALAAAGGGSCWPMHVAELVDPGLSLLQLLQGPRMALHTVASTCMSPAAAWQVVMTTWTQHFCPLLKDFQVILTFDYSGGRHSTICCSMPHSAQYASEMLSGVVEFLGMHSCWSCVYSLSGRGVQEWPAGSSFI